jgi:hypothetical protein
MPSSLSNLPNNINCGKQVAGVSYIPSMITNIFVSEMLAIFRTRLMSLNLRIRMPEYIGSAKLSPVFFLGFLLSLS